MPKRVSIIRTGYHERDVVILVISFLPGCMSIEGVFRQFRFTTQKSEVLFWDDEMMVLFHLTDATATLYN